MALRRPGAATAIPAAVLAMLVVPPGALAQSASNAAGEADFSGVWTSDPPENTRPWFIYSFSADLPDLTEWGQARFEDSRPTFGPRSVPVADTNDPVYDCYPPGTARIYLHPFPMEIVQTGDRVLMLFEYDHHQRQIYTDGRDHRTDLAPSWMGDSTGYWEDGVLVVETLNFNDRSWLDRRGVPHSDRLRVTERISLTDDGRLQIDIAMEDPVALAEPWVGQRFYRKTDWQVVEFVCLDTATFDEFETSILEFDPAVE